MIREELSLEINDLQLAAIRWRPEGDHVNQRFLCVHGWLDNAGSFEALGQQLSTRGFDVLALDLAGCGKTSHRSLHGYYNLWDDLIDLEAVLEQFEWNNFVLAGHSRGAGVSALYAATQPVGLRGLILLDGIVPPDFGTESLPVQIRGFIDERKQALNRNKRENTDGATKGLLASYHDAWEKRKRLCNLSFEDMEPLLARALVSADVEGYFKWSHDQRLNGRSIYRLSHADKVAMLGAITVPALMMVAEQGRVKSIDESAIRELMTQVPDLTVKSNPGDHHFHMERDKVNDLAELLILWMLDNDIVGNNAPS